MHLNGGPGAPPQHLIDVFGKAIVALEENVSLLDVRQTVDTQPEQMHSHLAAQLILS